MAKAQWILDPGHGYLRVPLATCEGLEISGYSYHGISREGIPVTVCQRNATCRRYNRFRGAV